MKRFECHALVNYLSMEEESLPVSFSQEQHDICWYIDFSHRSMLHHTYMCTADRIQCNGTGQINQTNRWIVETGVKLFVKAGT